MKLEHSGMQSDSSRSVREADRHNKMATEGHRKKSKAEKLENGMQKWIKSSMNKSRHRGARTADAAG
jgi:hypothetical protein